MLIKHHVHALTMYCAIETFMHKDDRSHAVQVMTLAVSPNEPGMEPLQELTDGCIDHSTARRQSIRVQIGRGLVALHHSHLVNMYEMCQEKTSLFWQPLHSSVIAAW
jgi:hypothetical protein